MKNIIVLATLIFANSLLASPPGYIDTIHDDYTEAEKIPFHTRGLLTYGSHSNTFHVRQFHARYNYQLTDVQFFMTLRGHADTHDPPTNYGYILNNISLYDYGAYFRFWGNFFFSPRGAATYRENFHSYLLVTPYYHVSNVAEFDSPSQFQAMFPTGPGIRIGYAGEHFEVGYSQGDFRHVIPSGIMAKAFGDDWYVRGVVLSEYADPLVYRADQKRHKAQLSYGQHFYLTQEFRLAGIAEATYFQNGVWVMRFEEAVQFHGYTLGIRQLVKTASSMLLEFSFTRNFENAISVGVYYASTGNIYFGSEINF